MWNTHTHRGREKEREILSIMPGKEINNNNNNNPY